jgi:hypothetical protein
MITNKGSKPEIIKIYSLIIASVLNNNIKESIFIHMMHNISNMIDINSLKSITNIIQYFQKNQKKYMLHYKFLVLLFVKTKLENKIKTYKLQFTKNKKMNNYDINLEKIKQLKSYLNSYKKISYEFKSRLSEDEPTISETETTRIYNQDFIRDEWYNNHSIEAIKRLKLLVDKFGIHFLLSIGIEILDSDIINNMSHKSIILYHNNVVLKIRLYVKSIYIVLKIYNKIIELYRTMLTLKLNIESSKIDIRKFEELVEFKDNKDFDNFVDNLTNSDEN